MGKKTKIFVLTAFLLFVGVLAADVVYSLRYRSEVHEGSGAFLCEAFKFSDDLLNGYKTEDGNHNFIGIDNVISAVENISTIVAENSADLQSVVTIVDQTGDITYALDEFLLYLTHMNDLLGDSSNRMIGNYECVFCNACCSGGSDSMTSQVVSSISSTVASALSQVRSQVQSALTGDGLDSIRAALTSAEGSISDMQSQIDKTVDSVFVSNKSAFDAIVQYVDIATIVIIASMGVPFLLLILSVFIGVFRSNQTSFFDPSIKPRNPCGISFSWCVTFLFAFLLFLIAGLVGIASYVVASGCEILADPTGMLHDTLSRLDSGNSNELTRVTDTCLSDSGSGDLLSSITLSGNETLRSSLDISPEINAQFDQLDKMVNSFSSQEDSQFSKNPNIVALIDAMDTFGTLFTLQASTVQALLDGSDPSLVPSASLVAAASSPSDVEALLAAAVTGIPDCGGRSNVDIGDGSTSVSSMIRSALNVNSAGITNIDFQGLSDFAAAIAAAGIDIGTSGNICPSDFFSLHPPDESLAAPFDALVRWRVDVLTNTFRCDEISISPDSVTGKATASTTSKSCSFDEWIASVSSMRTTLMNAALNVDTIQASTIDRIQSDLRILVTESVLPAVNVLLDGMDCRFIHERYMGLYGALCWKEVPGLIGSVITWLIFGCLCLVAIIVEFVLWRNLKDNLSLWRDNVKGTTCGVSQEGTLVMALPPPSASMQASMGYNGTPTRF